MWFSTVFLRLLGVTSVIQSPFLPTNNDNSMSPRPNFKHENSTLFTPKPNFNLVEGSDVFSPKDMLELARPGAGVPNHVGDLILVSVSKYSFENKKNAKSIFIAPLNPTTEPLEIPLANGGEAFWLDDRTVAHVVAADADEKDEEKKKDKKYLEVYAISVEYDTQVKQAGHPPVLLGTIPTTSATNFRYVPASGRLVFSDYVYADGNITTVNEQDEKWENRGNTAYVYDVTYERHWDHWIGPKTSTLFSVELKKSSDNKWVLGQDFINHLLGTGHETPVEPFGGTDDFDVSESHIVYTAKDPILPFAWHTKQNVYLVSLKSGSKPKELTSGNQGATHSPVITRDGTKAAWTEMDKDGYEADRAKIVIYDIEKDVRFTITQQWDRSADSLAFSPDGQTIYFTAGDLARVKVYALPVPATPSSSTTHPSLPPQYSNPLALTSEGFATGLYALPNARVLFSRSTGTSPNDVFVLDVVENEATFKAEQHQVTRFTEAGLKEKKLPPLEDFWFEGAEGKKVQGFVVKPRGWTKDDEKKKWPVVLVIHGGPQSAWEDSWSTRWNPAVFAHQGYFTVLINPTGSTTFGQEFTDAIAGDWGGKPFVDLQKGWKYILEHYPEVNPDRAVAAGASWGGYAINWIQGHPEFGFGFKALACHDGVFDVNYNGYSTDELYFFNHEWGGKPWEKKAAELIHKFSPSNFVQHWSTPQLVIHSSKDYRLPETDGIGAFHALQEQGIPSRLVIFPDENHWVLNQGNSLKWHYEVFRWFDQFVGETDN